MRDPLTLASGHEQPPAPEDTFASTTSGVEGLLLRIEHRARPESAIGSVVLRLPSIACTVGTPMDETVSPQEVPR
jgi:hypothetical protein